MLRGADSPAPTPPQRRGCSRRRPVSRNTPGTTRVPSVAGATRREVPCPAACTCETVGGARLVAQRHVALVGITVVPVRRDVHGLADRRLVRVEVRPHLPERHADQCVVDRAMKARSILPDDPETQAARRAVLRRADRTDSRAHRKLDAVDSLRADTVACSVRGRSREAEPTATRGSEPRWWPDPRARGRGLRQDTRDHIFVSRT